MSAFSTRVLQWFAVHGRHDLPWQKNPDPYRVWVSEIMLQQTQVSTVIPYFIRFMQYYPTLQALATAPQDEVLHLWTGLGYYARARNLHKAAQMVHLQFDGHFPETVEGLCSLPGIGRSTAGAILALGSGRHAPILDGNVKRVLCRYHAIEGWPDQSATLRQLWSIAEHNTPEHAAGPYAQAMMDLGATVCTRSKPVCARCPLNDSCAALLQGRVTELPHRKPKAALPVKQVHMLMCLRESPAPQVLLERRPASGIWGGLWSFPEFAGTDECKTFGESYPAVGAGELQCWAPVRHTFSHFHLVMTPVLLPVISDDNRIMEPSRWLWYPLDHSTPVGLAAPVKKLLQTLSLAATPPKPDDVPVCTPETHSEISIS